MNDHLKQDLDVLYEVRDAFTKPTTNPVFQEVMGHVRDAIKRLENLSNGCPSGAHATECNCREDVKGSTVQHLKYRRAKGDTNENAQRPRA